MSDSVSEINEKAWNYYKSAIQGARPNYVPSRIYLPNRVQGDGPFRSTFAEAGEHECSSNSWGALSVRATNGQMLGIKPAECEPVAWRENAMEGTREGKEQDLGEP